MVNSVKKKKSIKNIVKSKSKAISVNKKIANLFSDETVKLQDLDLEDEKILKEFKIMENRLKNVKNVNKAQEIKNTGPTGVIEKTLVKSNPEKKLRRTFKGCNVQSRVTVYENVDENAEQNEYLEIKKIYRKCPKKN